MPVLDRFHIMAHFSKALDEVRAGEAKVLKAKGYKPVLSKTRWLLLKRPENLTENQETKLAELLPYNLKSVRAYLLMKKVARMLRRHRPVLLNWFRAKGQLSSGVVEGFNTRAKLTSRKSFSFRTFHGAEIALYHALGALVETSQNPCHPNRLEATKAGLIEALKAH